MRPIAFYELCKILAHNNLHQETIHMSIREQVLTFTHTIGHNVRFRVVGGRFYRSIETVHRYFKHVLGALMKNQDLGMQITISIIIIVVNVCFWHIPISYSYQ